jgi:hypothetical protein
MHRTALTRALHRRSFSTTTPKEFATVLSPEIGTFELDFDSNASRIADDPVPLLGFRPARVNGVARPAPQPLPAPVLYDGPAMGSRARTLSTAGPRPTSLGPVTTFDGPSRLRSVSTRSFVPVSRGVAVALSYI